MKIEVDKKRCELQRQSNGTAGRVMIIQTSRMFVDGLANITARWTYAIGLSLRNVQTGRIRQYVMLIVVGTVALFILTSFFWSYSQAGM
jgi:hypothetical protein